MRKLYEICFGCEPTEKELALLEILFQRLLDNGYSEQDAQKLLLNNKLTLNDFEWNDSLINTDKNTIYYHYELQIHSKPNHVDPVTLAVVKHPYYLEMKYRYTMENLLDYYYKKLIIPMNFRDEKRDKGAFNHLLSYYNFDNIHTVDFLLFVIDYIVANEYKITNPLELKNWAQITYEYLELNIICHKPYVKYREELIQ
jgi:hypothetical protein